MKRMMSVVCGVSAAIVAVADVAPSGVASAPMTLDIESVVRTEETVGLLTYDTLWQGVTNADYRILVNGAVLSTGSGVGAVTWHPTTCGTYTLTYQAFLDNAKVGEDMTAIFTLAGKDLVNAEIALATDEMLYDGSAQRPKVTIVYNQETLIEGVDYSLEYENNVNPGVATMTIRGMGRFSDVLEKNFTIRPAGICFLDIESGTRSEESIGKLAYDTQWQGVTNADYRILVNGAVLSTGSGVGAVAWHPTKYGTYTLTYQAFLDNAKVGEDMTAVFTLAGKDLVNAEIALAADGMLYDGTAQRPKVTIVYNQETLIEGVDYSLEYENNVNPGVATMTIRGMGRFSDVLERNFTIRPAGICFLDIESGTRTNAAIHPIAYSPQWNWTNASAIAEVAVDGVVVSSDTMEGSYEWMPPTRMGTSVLTHVVKVDGKAVGETLSASFAYLKPDGGPYKESVDGIEWTYCVAGGQARVGSGSSKTAIPSSTSGAITVPSMLGGCLVTSIGGYAFDACGFSSVTIPASVTNINDYAFYWCTKLVSVYFDGNAPTMGECVFSGCAAGCTAYVKKGSTGWGVDIPGTWNGINIAYYTAYEVEGAGEVKIHDDWVEKYAPGKSEAEVTELLAQTAANGKYKNWECYVLGLDPTNAESKIVVSAPQSQDSGSISVALNLNVPAGCGYTVSNEVTVTGGSGGHVVTALPNGFTIDLTGSDDPSGLYTIKVKLVPDGSSASTSEIEVEQTVGVRKSTSELTKTAIAVPWGELTGSGVQAICVSNLVKTANLTAGDKLYVYNTASRAYETWQLSSNKTWEPLATYVILEDGTVSKTSAGAPTTTMVARGSAVWLERQDTSKPFYLYGEYKAGTIETSIVGGTTETPVWNFVAPPTLGGFDLNNITGASEDDKIVVTTANGPKIYTYKQGAWGSDVNTTVTRTLPGGGTIEVVKKTRDTTNTTIAAGTGFMYVSQGGAPTIQW